MYNRLFSILIVFVVLVTGCHAEVAQTGADETAAKEVAVRDLSNGEKLKVVATTNIIGDLASNVGGDMIELTTLLPIGADPHNFVATPQDVAAVAGADLVLKNGLGLEQFLEEIIENSGGHTPIVSLAEGVPVQDIDDETRNDNENTVHEQSHEHAVDVDPHIWVIPDNAIIMTRNIEQALAKFDPANAEAYAANAKAYQAQLAALDGWVETEIDSIPPENRKLVTDHDTLSYYANRYGLALVGAIIPAYSTNAEPSAQELAQLQRIINQHGVKAVFVGTGVSQTMAQRIAEDSGVRLVSLYTGSLGEPGSGAETYIDYIKYNTNAIVEALQ